MQVIPWLRTHVALRNGAGGINTCFMAPEYEVRLDDRVFHIFRKGIYVTSTGMENAVEFTAEGASLEQKTIKKTSSKASA